MNMQKIYVLLHAKLYNIPDFEMWFKWYTKFIKADYIIIINDSSILNLDDELTRLRMKYNFNNIQVINFNDIPYNTLSNLDNQTYNYNYVIQNIIPVKINDVIIIPDDDEFWWYDTTKFNSFLDCITYERKKLKTDCLLVANILMCNNIYLEHRNKIDNFNDISKYRCDLTTCEHKPIIFYNNEPLTYIHHGTKNSVPIGKFAWNDNRGSQVLYNHYLRLYHYRLTTNEEYKRKMSSCAIRTDLVNNFRYFAAKEIKDFLQNSYSRYDAQFNILDLTISNELEKL